MVKKTTATKAAAKAVKTVKAAKKTVKAVKTALPAAAAAPVPSSPRFRPDPERERRITDEAVVDAYNEEERAMGWYYYLDDRLAFPFRATCIRRLDTSPFEKGETVEVIGMAKEDDCLHDILVRVRYAGGVRPLAVPLGQLRPETEDAATLEAVADWHYWLASGEEF